MTDLHELYTEAEAAAISKIYGMDKRGGVFSSVPQCFIDMTARVPESSPVWHYARVLANVVIGENCSIGGGTEIGRGSVIGEKTRIGANCFLPPNSAVGSHVFIGPNVTFTDDRFPKIHDMANSPYHAEPPVVGDHANIGAAAVILPGVKIGKGANIAAGAVVTGDVPDGVSVIGIPARPFVTPPRWMPRS